MKSKTTKILALTAALFGLGITTPAMAAVQSGTKVISYSSIPGATQSDSTIYDYVYGVFKEGGTLDLSFTMNYDGTNCGAFQCIFHAGAKDTGFSIYENGGPHLIFGQKNNHNEENEVYHDIAKGSHTIVCRFANNGTDSASVCVFIDGTRYDCKSKKTWSWSDMAWSSTAAECNKYSMGCQAPGWGSAETLQTTTITDNKITATYTSAELSKMYSNRLSGGNAVVTPGTYGAITVPGAGYKATAFTSATVLTTTTSGDEVTGNYANIIQKTGQNGDTRQHTFAGWFRPDDLTAEKILWFAYSNGFIGSNDNGYKVCATTAGKIKIVKTSGDANDNGTALVSSDVVFNPGDIKWAHVAVAFTWGGSGSRYLTPTLFVNGVQKTLTGGTTIGSNLAGGENGAAVRLGAGISAAGIYVDQKAIAGDRVIEAATGFVVAAPYTATVTTSANWANLNWSPSKPSAGADVKLIRNGDAADAKVTIDEDVTLAKLTVTSASGKSLTLKVGNTLAATTYDFSGTVKIGGAGKVTYTTSGTEPAYPTWTWVANGDDAWTGTYALSGFNGAANKTTCGNEGWNLVPYYNGTKSKFEFNGTVTEGWFNNVPFSVGELVLPKSKSITFTDGHSSEYKGAPVNNYCFTKLSGEGSITINTSTTASPGIKISDVSEFTGTISNTGSNSDGNGYRVILGDGSLAAVGDTPTKAAIHFTGAAVLRSVQFYATRGSIAHEDSVVTVADNAFPNFYTGALAFANGSELAFATKNGTVTANAGVTVESNVTVPVTIMDTTDFTAKTLVVWNSNQQPSGSFELMTGSGAAKGTSGFKASKNDTNLTAIADTTKTYYEVEGGETTTFDNQWLASAGISGSAEQVQTALDTPNANGIKPSDAYLMGYEAKDAQNAAVILKPDQTQSNGESISLSVAGVPTTTRNGAVITYTALASADRNWESPSVEEEMGATGSVSMALPTSGVLYYRVQANVALP